MAFIKMCLADNLHDATDCGGLALPQVSSIRIMVSVHLVIGVTFSRPLRHLTGNHAYHVITVLFCLIFNNLCDKSNQLSMAYGRVRTLNSLIKIDPNSRFFYILDGNVQ